MDIWTRLDRYQADSKRPLLLALGNFDGLHSGHREIILKIVEKAKKREGIPAVLTFFEHPQRVLRKDSKPGLLTSAQHRLFLFRQLGIQTCFLIHFTQEFAKLSPEEFVMDWLVDKLRVSEVHLGPRARFGVNRSGDVSLMQKLARKAGFDFYESDPVFLGDHMISSSHIRSLIKEGNLAEAEQFLGRAFTIFSTVVHGRGAGTRWGIPTANLRPHSEVLPPRGVYAVAAREVVYHLKPMTEYDHFQYQLEQTGKWKAGVLNHGIRPTIGPEGQEVTEVHLLDFNGNLYGKTLEVAFKKKIRDEKTFRNSEELAEAIRQDIAETRALRPLFPKSIEK